MSGCYRLQNERVVYFQKTPVYPRRAPLELQTEGGQVSELPLHDDFGKDWEDVVLIRDGHLDLEVLDCGACR